MVAPSSYSFFHVVLLFPPLWDSVSSSMCRDGIRWFTHSFPTRPSSFFVYRSLRLSFISCTLFFPFLYFGLPFPPLYAMKESDSPQTVVRRECAIFITF